ncbi:MAG: efflux RND transporter periplasmic adaptor subunit [Rhodospirillales bacterium]|nr:efflux RND transporter periplasmic adaptor subunit [Rhodospirillales bacterium]
MTETSQTVRRFKSSHVIAVLLAVGTTAWIGSGVVTGDEPKERDGAAGISEEAPLPLVRVMQSAAHSRAREVILFGRTQAINKANIAAEISGRIVKKSANKGDQVTAGQVLFQLSMEDRMSQLAEASAKLDYQDIAYKAAKELSEKHFQSRVKLAQEKANLETAKAALKAIELEISKTTIRSPVNGVINALSLSVGDYVKSGDIVAAVVDLSPLRIVGQVSERDVARIRANSAATAVLPDGRKLEGEVRFISRVGSSATRTFDVDVWIENEAGLIPEGLTAELRLQAESERAHLVSPAVLTLDGDGAIGVKSVNDAHIVAFHRVKIVADTPAGVWLGGLPELITLITVGQEFVVPGQKVRTATEAEIQHGGAIDRPAQPVAGDPS